MIAELLFEKEVAFYFDHHIKECQPTAKSPLTHPLKIIIVEHGNRRP